ncbi:hypothetical protein P152DRAFT_458332 [Eremomyces bilateralis CBS 781.70]|uniref:Transcription factor Iwr1 domain-containing protein n=1 Tax=Eremomyces bilateralis CBS 781.70 TaxID=1392243 RepID=A0A6G1G3U3_9PEZI|nr:uncharacterized protein P152DRAFT_458332 [Eremomyces bilateralis CBS 781.70]KAF1812489.1 hypothetical protein P152DRAFT_458332 [Eremomyces bilateralis CBS 781.70]
MSHSSPQLVHIKRRKSEPHVDLLYVERPNKKKFTDQGYYFRRLDQESGSAFPPSDGILQKGVFRPTQPRSPAPDRPPPVRATAPGDEDRDPFALRVRKHQGADNRNRLDVPGRQDAVLPTHPIARERVRRFHLMRHRSLTPSALNPSKKRKSEIATFVEKSDPSGQATPDDNTWTSPPVPEATATEQMAPSPKRKRPNVRALRDRVRDQSIKNAPPTENPEELRQLAEEMSRWAQEVETGVGLVSDIRQEEPQNNAMQVDMTTSGQQEGEYVYDTFVQYEATDNLGLSTNNVGILVIEEEDEEYWESYMHHEQGEYVYSDEEDENAEDWYGNDYPEDEVDSDDEYNVDPYKYRDRGSDDEQYDVDTWSDEEGERKRFEALLKNERAFYEQPPAS